MAYNLIEAVRIARGELPNRTSDWVSTEVDLEEAVDERKSSSSSSVSDYSDDDGVSPGLAKDSNLSEIEELLLDIRQRIDTLFRFIIFIRQYATVDDRSKALTSTHFSSIFDIQHIKDRFRDAGIISHTLAVRLGEANARRRQYFKYCRDHHARKESAVDSLEIQRVPKIETDRIPAGTGAPQRTQRTAPSTHADTEFTKFNLPLHLPLALEPDPEPARSVRSVATSIAEDDASELHFPPLPDDAATSRPFLCNLCYKFVELPEGMNREKACQYVVQLLLTFY